MSGPRPTVGPAVGDHPAGDPPDEHPGWSGAWGGTRASRVVGHGPRAFARARAGLLGWDVQRLAGVTVPTTTPPVAVGVHVRQTVGSGGLLVAACEVTDVVDDARRAGFTYETRRPHPEEGWESFLLEHRDDGSVTVAVTSRSRLAWAPARLLSPLARGVQRVAVVRYLRAAQQLAR